MTKLYEACKATHKSTVWGEGKKATAMMQIDCVVALG